jgi:hypothetical protein
VLSEDGEMRAMRMVGGDNNEREHWIVVMTRITPPARLILGRLLLGEVISSR